MQIQAKESESMSSEETGGLPAAPETAPTPLTPTAPPPPSPVPAPSPLEEQLAPQPAPPPVTMPAIVNNLPTIFGEIFERDVTFCVDTSGSMFNCLHVIKEQLIETLFKHAQREGNTTFNIIEFNSEVTQWADKMVSCTPETVQVAADWIKKLAAKTGTNTMDALLTALQDNACQAVYLVTDGLPDTFAEDILDTVINAANGRPIHCIYLAREKAETAAVEFLEDLAVESFGSLHIATLTQHGCVERVTPVYRAEHAYGRVIRTVNNTLRPNFKTCSVATTLQIDPEEVLNPVPRAASLGLAYQPPFFPPWWGWRYWGLGMYPHRYNFPSTWSRYRPAKSWLRAQDKLADIPDGMGLSPSAGALLIGKQVLSRRIADGYFYMGSVQSQILDDKFLVAFGPCKHGKFRETTYQDTYVYDIVDYVDAQRHTIITGDHVLAPWEPEGERYGPGKVIDGQERRQAVGPEDHQLTVAFSNGHTEKVLLNKAIWVPQPVYERVSLELKMPRDTRSTIMTTDHYPLRNLPGYPTSGPQATPPEFYTPENFSLEPTTHYHNWGLCMYPPYLGYYPPYPVVVRRRKEQSEKEFAGGEDEDTVIPGTDMTRKELEERITSQISEHVEGQQTSQTSGRLLKKREKLEENSLKKSVTFSDSNLVHTATKADPGTVTSDPLADTDSGFASSPELELDPMAKEQMDAIDEERRRIALEKRWIEQEKRWLEEEERRILDAKNDPRLQFYRSPGIGRRPPWKYWRNDPCPPLPSYGGDGGSSGGGGGGVRSSNGAFRETALQAPLEARDQRMVTGSVEWTSPAFKYVDTFAKHDYSNSVEECLKPTQPPASGEPVTGSFQVRVPQPPTEEEKVDARRAYRRKRFMERQQAWQERLQNEDRMKVLMEDGHRERIQAQIAREQERQQQEQNMINRAREAKQKISKELRERIEKKQAEEKEREEKRIEAMKERRERREEIEAKRQQEIEETQKRREEIRRQNNIARHDAVTKQLNEEEARNNAINNQHRNAKLNRLNHFHSLEEKAQAHKDLRVAVTDQHLALYRSQIFP
ncbi:uncharacterized protein LOC143282915 isoform X2 [Babylonia areolata]|uniref:uncharacterized protein LOC143282915 isoform X2 n=1 Tax=Babylonia areolata TaxID=304850 RepID=UPI003FD110ED